MDETAFAWLRLLAFAAAALPALLANLRTDALPNSLSGILLLGGAAAVAAEAFLVPESGTLPLAFWALAAVGLVGLGAFGAVPAGIAKFLVALLPWFDDPFDYLTVATIGFFLAAALGWLRGGAAPAAAGFYLAGAGVLAISAI